MRRVDRLLGDVRALRIRRAMRAQGKVDSPDDLDGDVCEARRVIAGLSQIRAPSVLGLRPTLTKDQREAMEASGIAPGEEPRRDEVPEKIVDLIDQAPLEVFKTRATAIILDLVRELDTLSRVAESCYARLVQELDPPAAFKPKRPRSTSPDDLASGDPGRVRALSAEDVGVIAVELALFEVCALVMKANDASRPTRVTKRAVALATKPLAKRRSPAKEPISDVDAKSVDAEVSAPPSGTIPSDCPAGPVAAVAVDLAGVGDSA